MKLSRFAATVLLSGIVLACHAEWYVESVDYCGIVSDPAICLGSDGLPGIAYAKPNGAAFAFFNGSSWEKEYIHQLSGSFGYFDMLADCDNTIHCSFMFQGVIFYAVQDPAADGWTVTSILYPLCATWTSIALNSQGNPGIAVLDTDEDNRYLFWNGIDWENELIETGNDQYGSIALAFDTADAAHAAYNSGASSTSLKYAVRDASGQWTVTIVDSSMSTEPRGISMVLKENGYPVISYNVGGELRCASLDGVSWNVESVYSCDTGAFQYGTSIALDGWDCPHIVHCSADGSALLYSVNHGTGWQTETIPCGGLYAECPDIALDSANRPHIAFQASNMELMYAYSDEAGTAGSHHDILRENSLTLSANPFSGSLEIGLTLPVGSLIRVRVMDLCGREVACIAEEYRAAGEHTLIWTPDADVPDGTYVVAAEACGTARSSRTVLLR